MSDYTCSICEQPCFGEKADIGNGPYEFWGQRGVDVQIVFQSECCEGLVMDDKGKEVFWEDVDEDGTYEAMKQKRVDDELEKKDASSS